jgi:hypothetical protein
MRCPLRCPTGQIKRPQQLVATEGVLLNTLDVANVLDNQFVIRNEEVRGSSPLTSTKFPHKLILKIAPRTQASHRVARPLVALFLLTSVVRSAEPRHNLAQRGSAGKTRKPIPRAPGATHPSICSARVRCRAAIP